MNIYGPFMLAVILGTLVVQSEELLADERVSNETTVIFNVPDINVNTSLKGTFKLGILRNTNIIHSKEVISDTIMSVKIQVGKNSATTNTSVYHIVPKANRSTESTYTSWNNSVSPNIDDKFTKFNNLSTKYSDDLVYFSFRIVNSDYEDVWFTEWNVSFPSNHISLRFHLPTEIDAKGFLHLEKAIDANDWMKFSLTFNPEGHVTSSSKFLEIDRIELKQGLQSIVRFFRDPFGLALSMSIKQEVSLPYSKISSIKVSVRISSSNTFLCTDGRLTISGLSLKGQFIQLISRFLELPLDAGDRIEEEVLTNSVLDWKKINIAYNCTNASQVVTPIAIDEIEIKQGHRVKRVCKYESPFLIRNGKVEPLHLQNGSCSAIVVSFQIKSINSTSYNGMFGNMTMTFKTESGKTQVSITEGAKQALFGGTMIRKKLRISSTIDWTSVHITYGNAIRSSTEVIIENIIISHRNTISSFCSMVKLKHQSPQKLLLQNGRCSESEVSLLLSTHTGSETDHPTGDLYFTIFSEKNTDKFHMSKFKNIIMYPGARLQKFPFENVMSDWTKFEIMFITSQGGMKTRIDYVQIGQLDIRSGNNVTSFSNFPFVIVLKHGLSKTLHRNAGVHYTIEANGIIT